MLPPSRAIADPNADPCWETIATVAPSSKPRLREPIAITLSTAASSAGTAIAARSRPRASNGETTQAARQVRASAGGVPLSGRAGSGWAGSTPRSATSQRCHAAPAITR